MRGGECRLEVIRRRNTESQRAVALQIVRLGAWDIVRDRQRGLLPGEVVTEHRDLPATQVHAGAHGEGLQRTGLRQRCVVSERFPIYGWRAVLIGVVDPVEGAVVEEVELVEGP